jgi:hypothetical protein
MLDYLTDINKAIYQNSTLIDAALGSIIPILIYSTTVNVRKNVSRLSDIRGKFLEQISRLYTSYTQFNFDKELRDWLEHYIKKIPDADLAAMVKDIYSVKLLNYVAEELRRQISAITLVEKYCDTLQPKEIEPTPAILVKPDTKAAGIKLKPDVQTWANTLLLYSYYEYMCKLYSMLRAHYTESIVMTALNPVFNRFISKFVNNNPEILIMFLESNAIPYLQHNGENILIYRAMILTPRFNISSDMAAARAGIAQYLGAVISTNKLKAKAMSRCEIIKHILSRIYNRRTNNVNKNKSVL